MSLKNRSRSHAFTQPKFRCSCNSDRVEEGDVERWKPSRKRSMPGRLPPHHRCGQAGRVGCQAGSRAGNSSPPQRDESTFDTLDKAMLEAKIDAITTSKPSRRVSSSRRSRLQREVCRAGCRAGLPGWQGGWPATSLTTKNV